MINQDEKSKKDTDRGYTDEQRAAALKEEHMRSPSPWMKVMSNPWPNKKPS